MTVLAANIALRAGGLPEWLNVERLSDAQRNALDRAFERTIQACELLVTLAVAIAGKPSKR